MEHQTVVVTGASAGIGRATARLFGERGASVGLIARGQEGLRGAVREVEDAGGKALAVSADVADYEQVAAAARQIEETLGPIDVWVNVAFTSVFSPFAEITAEEFRRVTEVSYLGFVYGTMAALSRMRPRNRRRRCRQRGRRKHAATRVKRAAAGVHRQPRRPRITRSIQLRSSRRNVTSCSNSRRAAATGIATSAPTMPRSVPPTSTATSDTTAGTLTVLPMIRGTSR